MAIDKLRLPRLPLGWKEQPQLFERYWDEAMTSVEKALNAIIEIPSLQSAIEQAQQAADNANSAAASVNDQTSAQAKEQSLINSYVTGASITASDDGTVSISTHQRVYGDSTLNPSVTVQAGSVATGEAPGKVIRVYYDDPNRTGGAVIYKFTVDPAPPPVQAGDRHSVGVATIPATGQPAEPGDYVKPPGYVSGRQPLQ